MSKRRLHIASRSAALLLASGVSGSAQDNVPVGTESEFMPRSSPYPRYYSAAPRDYNLKWGKLTGHLHGSVQAEFNDNINLAHENAESDLSFEPLIGVGFLWPISEKNVLEFDISAGYRFYLDHPELNSVNISPDSRLTYQIRVLKAQVTLHDQFSVQVDPLTRPELSGNGQVFNYQRLNNNVGWTARWQAIREVTFVSGYSFVIDRSISGDFRELDRDDHVFTLGVSRPFGARITAGVGASYTITDFLQPVQNDGTTISAGPNVAFKVTDFLIADAGVSYTTSEYEENGTILDREDFSGLTYYAGLRHRMNSRTTHTVRVSKSVTPGYGSNFTDIFGLQYGITLALFAPITLNATFAFEDFTSSGAFGEDSQRYLWYMGTTFRFSSRWYLGASYGLGIKDSQLPGRDYTQNRFTLQMTRRF